MTVLTLTAAMSMNAQAPNGWHRAGSQRDAYEIGTDSTGAHAGKGSGYIKSIATVDAGKFGTSMQNIKADEYRGKSVKMSAFVKTSDAKEGAWLWLRVDDTETGWLDNMNDRQVKGTTGWQRYELVLPVSKTALGIAFGIGLIGTGQAWIDDVKFEAVSAETPKTGNLPEMRRTPEMAEGYKNVLAGYASKPASIVNGDFEQ